MSDALSMACYLGWQNVLFLLPDHCHAIIAAHVFGRFLQLQKSFTGTTYTSYFTRTTDLNYLTGAETMHPPTFATRDRWNALPVQQPLELVCNAQIVSKRTV